jgi:hypothetical protein
MEELTMAHHQNQLFRANNNTASSSSSSPQRPTDMAQNGGESIMVNSTQYVNFITPQIFSIFLPFILFFDVRYTLTDIFILNFSTGLIF